ncbi:polyprenyl synthetase family protein [Anaerotruncus colihominis]|uniref:polyprenyl synthetase family protein n=1 Tax=Anaerotruncus colihominis TaxID=169435 RepID=UPI001FF39648|nr:farnesyl diphosphate synthase [Anaerotruncus colihominis]UOX65308.1 polyprenyl synthetase family protein [Anaerotruncus colihominis]
MRFDEQFASYARQTNDALRDCLRYPGVRLQAAVVDAMRYSLLDAGKRLRAALVLEFARLASAPREGATALACAIEMLHAYSLIHDDLPCMDNDDFRRGKPSCHKEFGESTALLAGDALLTLAFETAAGAPLLTDLQRVEAVCTLSKAGGVCGMIGGQVIDLACEGNTVDEATLDTLCTLKTGALLRAAARLGCLAGKADKKMYDAADRYAAAVGLAFQITDDILDVTGDAHTLGKPVGSDAENHKTTYASLFGVAGAKARAITLIEAAKRETDAFSDNSFLVWLADMVLNRDH